MNKINALCFALAMPLMGCGWFGIGGPSKPKIPVVSQSAEGRTLGIKKYMLKLDEPADVHLEINTLADDAVVLEWRNGRKTHILQIDKKARYLHDDLDAMKSEYRTEMSAFSVGEGKELSNGFDLYYSYWKDRKLLAYQAELTIEGVKYRCFAYNSLSMSSVKAARDICRSLSKLEKLPVAKEAN